MKISDVKVLATSPTGRGNWVFIKIETDEGLVGYGEASNHPGSLLIIEGCKMMRPLLIGEDPNNIERIWHKLFRYCTALGSRGVPCSIIGGIDIALWDLKGKTLNRPVYDLLGGTHHNPITLYTHILEHNATPEEMAKDAKLKVAEGYSAFKFDPFDFRMKTHPISFISGEISKEVENLGVESFAAVREAVGPNIDILFDAHGNFDVPTAIRLTQRLAPYNLGWIEEPVPPESYKALAQVKSMSKLPICMGERLFTRYDLLPIFEMGLAEYINADVTRTGGISELRKISTMAEVYHVPVSPHGADGSIQILAGAHTMASVPNFYKLEFFSSALETYNAVLDRPLDIRGGMLNLSDRPGLGWNINEEYIKEHPPVTERMPW